MNMKKATIAATAGIAVTALLRQQSHPQAL